jgi:histone deacetylase 1/2
MSFNALMEKPKYAEAARKEITDIIESNIGTIVETPPEVRPIGTTWVFKEKDDGTVKARIAPHGYEQAVGKDYSANEVEAPTLHWITVMVIFILIMALGLSFKIGDVIGAFKLPELKDNVYLKLPLGMTQNNKLSIKLNKALYGLKQAAHHFHQLLHTLLTEEMEFNNAYFFDGCLYYKNTNRGLIIIGVYVDDIIIATKDMNIIDELFNKINKKLPLQFKEQQSYLGVEINYSNDALFLSNKKKIEELIIKYKLEDAAIHDTPVAPGTKLYKSDINEPVYKFPYRELIGSLSYIARMTRPDILYAVNQCARHVEHPNESHVKALKRILLYLKGTKDKCIKIKRNISLTDLSIIGYSDADHAGEPDGNDDAMRSTTGNLIFIKNIGLLFAQSILQPVISTSTAESEYIAAWNCSSIMVAIRQLFREMKLNIFDNTKPSELNVDNQTAIKIAESSVCSAKNRQINISFHKIKEYTKNREIALQYCNTKEMLADLTTKALPADVFSRLRDAIFNYS